METIIYQGQALQAEKVNYIDGCVPTPTGDHHGEEELFRDEAGRYYLLRRFDYFGTDPDTGHWLREASGRTLVHRLNLNAAILWATSRLNSDTMDLRCDAADLLMEGRGYRDPAPTHPMRCVSELVNDAPRLTRVEDGPRSSVTKDGWFDGCIQPEKGSGARVHTIFDIDPLHAALLKRFTEEHGINVAVLARAALIQQLEFMYNGCDREEEEAAVDCLREFSRLGPPAHEDEVACMEAVATPFMQTEGAA